MLIVDNSVHVWKNLVVGMGPRNRLSSNPDAPPGEVDVGSEYEHTNFDPVHAQIFCTLGVSEDAKFDASLHISKDAVVRGSTHIFRYLIVDGRDKPWVGDDDFDDGSGCKN